MELTLNTVPLKQMNLLIRCDLIMDSGKTWLKFVNRTYIKVNLQRIHLKYLQ